MPIEFTSDEIDLVRNLVRINHDEKDISNTVINSDAILGLANDYVDRRVKDPSQNQGNEKDIRAYRRSIYYRAAGYLLTSTDNPTFEGGGSLQVRVQTIDWETEQRQLFNVAENEITYLINRGFTADAIQKIKDPLDALDDVFIVLNN